MPERLQLGLDDPASERGNAGYQLEIGRVISQSFSVTWANVLPFYLVGVAVYAPALVVLALAATLPMSESGTQILITLSDLMSRILALVLSGALTYGVIEHLRGREPGVGATVGVGLRSAGRVFVVSLIAGIATLVGVVLCVVPGIIVFCMLWVAVPVAVIEHTGIQESMDRSQTLTKGTRMNVFALNLVMGLIVGVVGLAVYAGAIAGVAFRHEGGGEASASTLAAGQLAGSLLLIPFECLQAASVAVGYHDLRVNREGALVEDLVRVFE